MTFGGGGGGRRAELESGRPNTVVPEGPIMAICGVSTVDQARCQMLFQARSRGAPTAAHPCPVFQMRNRRPGEVREWTQDHPANRAQAWDPNLVWFGARAQALDGSAALFLRGLTRSLTLSLHFPWEAAEAQRREGAFPGPQSELRGELRLERILPILRPHCRSRCLSRKMQSPVTCRPGRAHSTLGPPCGSSRRSFLPLSCLY